MTSLGLKLLALRFLLADLTLELLLCLVDGPDALLSVLFKLLDLVLKTLLVFLVLLLVLALDDLLGLLGDSVELHVLGTFLEVLDLEVESLSLVPDPLKAGLELTDSVH